VNLSDLRPWAALLLAAVLLASCQTAPDRWLTDHLTPSEKADLLADRAEAALERLTETGDFGQADRARQLFVLARTADPAGTRASEGLKKLDAAVAGKQAESQAAVRSLTAKAVLTDKEKYTLAVLVRRLELLNAPGVDLSKLRSQTAAVRDEVLKATRATLAAAEKALAAAKTDPALVKAVGAAATAAEALRAVEPAPGEAAKAVDRLGAFLAGKSREGVAAAETQRRQGDFAAADRALDQLRALYRAAGLTLTPDLEEAAYRTDYLWAKKLFDDRKYGEAASRIADALDHRSTAEALELRDRIAQAAAVRDWDAEYDTLDRQIDTLIRGGDLKTAWNLVQSAGPRLKKDEPKSRLAARRRQVLEEAHELYDAAVAAYNEEDYAEAQGRLETVAAVDPTWKLTRSYLDKVKSKLLLLGAP